MPLFPVIERRRHTHCAISRLSRQYKEPRIIVLGVSLKSRALITLNLILLSFRLLILIRAALVEVLNELQLRRNRA